MKIISTNILRISLICFGSISSLTSWGQTKAKQIEIKNANSLEADDKIGKGVKRLIGDVQFKSDNTYMYCDSAYVYPDNLIHAFGRVHIQKGDSVNIYGQFLKYNGNTKTAELQRSVRLTDNGMTLQTELLFFNTESSVANYPNGGTIVSKENTLTSDRGYYSPNSRTFSFKKNVVLINPKYVINCDTMLYNSGNKTCYFLGPTTIKNSSGSVYCEYGWYNTGNNNSMFKKNVSIVNNGQLLKADSVLADQVKGVGKSYGHVSIADTTQNLIATGDYAIHWDKTKKSIITGHALLKQYDHKDTLFVHADSLVTIDTHPLKNNKPDTTISIKNLYAYHHVKFFRVDIQGKCDSLTYSDSDSLMRMYKSPVLWSDKQQLTAEHIEIKMRGGAIDRMFLNNKAFIVSKNDTDKYDQIKGKVMTGYFKKNKLHKIFIEGNGETIYFVRDKKSETGINKAECSNLMVYVKDNKPDKITFLKKPTAILYPMKDFDPKVFLLRDFIWREGERPLAMIDIFK